MGLDYYKVLFLQRGCTQHDVKQAYKKMALLHHPLRHRVKRPTSPSLRGREQEMREQRRQMDSYQMFHMVAEAFEILDDPKYRAMYDLYGEKGLKEGLPGPDGFIPPYVFHGDPHKTFKEFFNTDNPFSDLLTASCVPIDYFADSNSQSLRPKEAPIFRDLWLELEELYSGCVKKVMICKKTVIGDGNQMEFREKVLTITLQPGTPVGSQFSFPNEGDQGVNVQPADIVFIVRQRKHPVYTRDGDNLIYNTSVNLCEALTGLTIPITSLDKRTFNVSVVHIIRPGYEKIVTGEGFPVFGEPGRRGDLIIRFTIKYPNTLSQTQKKMTKTALDCSIVTGPTCYTKRLPETMQYPLVCVCPTEVESDPNQDETVGTV